ncbi:hypothetical protein KR032_005712 [Drosophila birchii]|nr:hypothetical protein KR032_005712 [Drosophila birchii]
MCFGNLFGGRRRHRSNAAPENTSQPTPSLANVPQVSVDNVRTVKSSKSIKSSNAAAAAAAASQGTFNVAPSVNATPSEARKSAVAGSGGEIPASASMVPNTSGPAGGSSAGISNVRSIKRNSWWGYFGMNKKKNSSIGSL